MKTLKKYLFEVKNTTGAGCIEMIQTILDQLINEHPDCHYDIESKEWKGKDADLWKGAGQFLFDYVKELNKSDLKLIIKHFGWEDELTNQNEVYPQQISVCIAKILSAQSNKAN